MDMVGWSVGFVCGVFMMVVVVAFDQERQREECETVGKFTYGDSVYRCELEESSNVSD